MTLKKRKKKQEEEEEKKKQQQQYYQKNDYHNYDKLSQKANNLTLHKGRDYFCGAFEWMAVLDFIVKVKIVSHWIKILKIATLSSAFNSGFHLKMHSVVIRYESLKMERVSPLQRLALYGTEFGECDILLVFFEEVYVCVCVCWRQRR